MWLTSFDDCQFDGALADHSTSHADSFFGISGYALSAEGVSYDDGERFHEVWEL